MHFINIIKFCSIAQTKERERDRKNGNIVHKLYMTPYTLIANKQEKQNKRNTMHSRYMAKGCLCVLLCWGAFVHGRAERKV